MGGVSRLVVGGTANMLKIKISRVGEKMICGGIVAYARTLADDLNNDGLVHAR